MISDSSPLILFGKVNQLDLLCRVYPSLLISEEVYQEVVVEGTAKKKPDAFLVREYIGKKRIMVRKLEKHFLEQSRRFLRLYSALEIGEASTLALALQEKSKEVLIDEHLARKVAHLLGLQPFGSLRVLLLGYQRSYLSKEEVLFLLRQLVVAGLYLGGDIVERFYELLAQIKKK